MYSTGEGSEKAPIRATSTVGLGVSTGFFQGLDGGFLVSILGDLDSEGWRWDGEIPTSDIKCGAAMAAGAPLAIGKANTVVSTVRGG